jgi:ribosomal protein S18 acetylase RimI-like enzyme
MIQIRQFRYPDDYTAVVSLWETAGAGIHLGRSDTPEEIAKKQEHEPDLFLLAEDGSKLVGSVIGGFDGRRGLVYHLAVDPAYRKQGLGTQLMNELEQHLKQKGCIRCYLLVTLDNESAMHFYEQRGWNRMTLATYAKDL